MRIVRSGLGLFIVDSNGHGEEIHVDDAKSISTSKTSAIQRRV